MAERKITRRGFGSMVGGGMAAAGLGGILSPLPVFGQEVSGAAGNLTAGDVVGRIRKQLEAEGVRWLESGSGTVDTIKTGHEATAVTGIATTFMATLDVMKRSADKGLNFIISHEPTYWNHMDQTAQLAGDAAFEAKKRFVDENNIVVWRFHDMWHARRPDPVFAAFAVQLGFGEAERGVYTVPAMSLGELGVLVAEKLGSTNVRVGGDSEMEVKTVGFNAHRLSATVRQLGRCDAVIMGEPREFDTFEYFRDAGEMGAAKGLVGVSHNMLEEWGMLEPCAGWVRGFVGEVPVEGVAAEEMYWVL